MTIERNIMPQQNKIMRSALVALAVTVALFITYWMAVPAMAQTERGAIPSPTLTSDAPGQLVITWGTPAPAPTDYRISWAHSSLDFLSYRYDNEAQRGNVYPAGGATTLTLNALTPGDVYKVQMRSRYYNADRSVHEWSGPWTATTTIRVMDEPAEPPQSDDQERTATATPPPTDQDENDDPPAAPTGLTVSRVGHSVLTLTWNDSEDDTVTGYRILRGPDADSLSTIQADTGSKATEYQDDTVEPETTYFYAVLALSANGDGAHQSTTLSATTAQAPKSKEEPPRVVPRQRNALTTEVLLSNIDQSTDSFSDFGSQDLAQRFTTGTDVNGYTLSSVELQLTLSVSTDFPTVKLFSGSANGTEIATLTPTSSVTTNDYTAYTFRAPAGIALTKETDYWIVGENGASLWQTAGWNTGEDATPAPGWSIHGKLETRSPDSTGAFSELAIPTPLKIRVNGTIGVLGRIKPTFGNTTETLTIDENTAAGVVVETITATQTGAPLTYSVSGAGATAFHQDFALNASTGAITVKSGATVDYEDRSSYIVTFQVTDNLSSLGGIDSAIDASLTLRINVNNLDDAGTVDISSEHPEVAMAIRATLTDPDGNVRNTGWQWYRGSSRNGSFTLIDNATGSSYTPVQADVRQYLKAKATYTDGHGAAKEAEAVARNATIPVSTNQAASFRSEHISVNVPENPPPGHVLVDVSVTDPNGDQLYYDLSGIDYEVYSFERTFDLGYTTGTITVKQGVVLDYEHVNSFNVTVKLRDELDPFGEYDYLVDDTATLTINVTNVDEPGTIGLEHVRSTTGAPTEVDVTFARLSDPDGVNRVTSWEWFRGDAQNGPFTEIDSGPASDGTLSGFRPEESDIGKYLKVKVTYADVFSTKVIEQTMGPVERWVSPYPDYAFWPGRWTDSGDLAVGGTQTGVIQGGFLSNGRYIRDVPEFFELTGMTAGTTYEVNLSGPGYGVSDIMGFYTIDTEGGGLFFKSRGDGQPAGYTSAQLRHVLFTPRSAVRIFVGITGAFAAEDLTYTVALYSK